LHPIKNLDAAMRMLACYMDGPKIGKLGPFRTALRRYAGKYNYEKYWNNVKRYMALLQDEQFMKKVEKTFNTLNPLLTIDGKKGNWQLYLESFRSMNNNYGLAEYQQLPQYKPKNSEIVKETIKKFF
jgi:hypothetical protein